MHVHFSVLDGQGRNLFDDGGPEGTDLLRWAVSGCLAAMPGCTLIFAPHGNSYTRLVPSAHAPTGASWAYENRTAAHSHSRRCPCGTPDRTPRGWRRHQPLSDVGRSAWRAALNGIEDETEPPAPITGQCLRDRRAAATGKRLGRRPSLRSKATRMMARIFPADLIRFLAMTKRQEIAALCRSTARRQHWLSYLEAV